MTAPTRIIDRGYRRYDGERGGVRQSMRSVVNYTIQRALGIHRKFRFKVMPIASIVISYVPQIVYIGVVVLSNRLDSETGEVGGGMGRQVASRLIQDYPGSYRFIVAAMTLFAAFVAPEVLCTDRKTGMFGLYMASPLDRWTYLLAKAQAVWMVMLLVTLGPSLVLLIGYATQGYGPSGFTDWITTILRVLATGLGLGAFYTMISMAISSITNRRAAASAAFIVLVMGSGVLVQVLLNETHVSPLLGMADVLSLPLEFAYRVFGQASMIGVTRVDANGFLEITQMPTWSVYAGFFGWIALSAALTAHRYLRLEVTK